MARGKRTAADTGRGRQRTQEPHASGHRGGGCKRHARLGAHRPSVAGEGVTRRKRQEKQWREHVPPPRATQGLHATTGEDWAPVGARQGRVCPPAHTHKKKKKSHITPKDGTRNSDNRWPPGRPHIQQREEQALATGDDAAHKPNRVPHPTTRDHIRSVRFPRLPKPPSTSCAASRGARPCAPGTGMPCHTRHTQTGGGARGRRACGS